MMVTAAFMGGLVGFLVRNFPPAKIFMGDTGSLFIGFFLAGLSLVPTAQPYSRGTAAVLLIPVLLLLIPIFDTAFVTATRLLRGLPVHVGGRDHTSHRLVAIGLSERKTIVFLAAVSAAAGGIAALSYDVGLSQTVVLLALLVIALALFGVHLSRIRVVDTNIVRNGGTVIRLLANFQYKRQVLTLLLDACLIPIAYYAAYVIRFENALSSHIQLFYGSVPAVLVIQLITLGAFGVYRGMWQYTGMSDLLRIGKATAVGTMATVVTLVYTTHFSGFSRTVFVLDWVLLFVLIAGSRVSFRLFAEVLRSKPESFHRVLIYGAGAGGELIVRELMNNQSLQRVPVGFLDDDRSKHQTRIHGIPVLGGSEDIGMILRRHNVQEIVVSSPKIQGGMLDDVIDACNRLDVSVRHASIRLE
jgi:UDP-GlcNAc:undecaprenyl-phosphate GlcNAc-1-phosphate transferase